MDKNKKDKKDKMVRAAQPAQPAAPEAEDIDEAFVIHLKYHQNRTWQGELIYEKSDFRAHFRSEYELLHLMDTILQRDEEEPDTI